MCTPGASPFRGLGQALAPELASDPEALRMLVNVDDPAAALELASRWRRAHAEALLVVDQFEELFTLGSRETQASFAALLGRLAHEADVHVLLSMRDDFLIRCSEQPPLAPVFESLTPLAPLSGEALRKAVEAPAGKRGYAFEDEALVEEMVESVEGVRGALPLLAFAVAQLWEKRDRERKLPHPWGLPRRSGVSPGPSPGTRRRRSSGSVWNARPWCARSSATWSPRRGRGRRRIGRSCCRSSRSGGRPRRSWRR